MLLNPVHFLGIATEFLWELLIWGMAAQAASFVIWVSHLGSGLVSPNLGILVEQQTGMAVHQQLDPAV